MKPTTIFTLLAALATPGLTNFILAQPQPNSAVAPATDAPLATSPGVKSTPSQEELETTFKATLTNATLTGRWCGIRDGQLTAEKEDKYTISSVTKIAPNLWVINARIQYGERDFSLPIPVKIEWAGDTPVLILDDFPTPGGRKYSARVLFFDNTYAGTWSGGDHAGLLNGLITHDSP